MKKYIIPASLVAPRDLARALLSQGTPLDVVAARTRLSRAQVLGVRWYAEQRAAARMALAACGVTP